MRDHKPVYSWYRYPEAGSASSQPVAVNDVQGRRGEDNLQAPQSSN